MSVFTTLESLKSHSKETYKKELAKDKKQLGKAKGVLVLDDYKFGKGAKDAAIIFTKKAKEAKEKFKAAKDAGHATAKMARGTCEVVKQGKEKLLKINFLEGALAPELVKTTCAHLFEKLQVVVEITNIPGPEPKEKDGDEEEEDEVEEQEELTEDQPEMEEEEEEQPEEEVVYEQLNDQESLLKQAREIGQYMAEIFPALRDKVKNRETISGDEYRGLNDECLAVRGWMEKYNETDKETKAKIGSKNALSVKECYVKLVQVRTGAFRLCPEAIEELRNKIQGDKQEKNDIRPGIKKDENNSQPDKGPKKDLNKEPKPGSEDEEETFEGERYEDEPREEENGVDTVGDKGGGTVPPPPAPKYVPPKALTASVGKGGINRSHDVLNVQTLLKNAGYSITPDGACGPKTQNAILDFQRQRCGLPKPDGRIDPGGSTWTILVKAGVPAAPPAPNDPLFKSLTYSVGDKGKNRSMDVLLVQQLLQKIGYTLAADGVCGKVTINFIRDFQKNKMKDKVVNGIVTPSGETWRALLAGKIDDKIDLRDKDAGKYEYTRIAYDLFVKGETDDHEIDESDIQQGQIGNCYFMSALAAVAKTNPEAIRKLIKDNGNGSYDVTLYAKGSKLALEPTIVTVKPDFVTDANGNLIYAGAGDRELWVMLMEKAYAKLNGGFDDTGEGGFIEAGLEAITGQDAQVYMLSKYAEADVARLLQEAIAAKKPITAASQGSGEKEFKTEEGVVIYQGHAYSVESVKDGKFFLRNPWGYDHATISSKEFKKYFNHFVF